MLAQGIIAAVNQTVEIDLELVKNELLAKLEEPSDEYIWPRAQGIAADAIDATWPAELVEQCERGLEHAHELFLRGAAACREAEDDLASRRLESWIAGAIRHRLAFDVCWDTLDDRHGVHSFESECSCGAGG